jgi:hypothetical protein
MTNLDLELKFDPELHLYTFRGEIIKSVTQILGSVGIIDGTYYTEKGKNRGTDVHYICQLYDEGDLDEKSIPEGLKGYFDGYLKFQDDFKIKILEIEKRVFNPKVRYAGTLDRLAISNVDHKYMLIDLKTGVIQPWVALQLAAYEKCLEIDQRIIHRKAVRLLKTGKYQVHSFSDPNDFEYFKCAAMVTHWKGK